MKWQILILATILIPISYGYNYTAYNSMFFETNGNGIINIEDHKYGFAITGKINGIPVITTSEDYAWTWNKTAGTYDVNDVNDSEDIINVSYNTTILSGTNNDAGLPIVQEYEDNSNFKSIKNTITVTNNLGVDVTDTKMWIINTVKEGDTVIYNGVEYELIRDINYHLQGDFNSVVTQFKYNFYSYAFRDIIDSGFNITDIYLGNLSDVGHPNKIGLAIGFTKGNGVFLDGKTITLDPVISSEEFPTTRGPTTGSWFNPDNILFACDNTRTFQSIAGTGDTIIDGSIPDLVIGLNPGEDIENVGIQVVMEASASLGCIVGPPRITPRVRLSLSLSFDGGTTFTAQKTQQYSCSNEVAKTYGGLTDDWGHTWTRSELESGNLNISTEVTLFADAGRARIDCQGVTIQYDILFGVPPDVILNFPDNETTFFQDLSADPFSNTTIILNWSIRDLNNNSYFYTVLGSKFEDRINETPLKIVRDPSFFNNEFVPYLYNWTGQTVDSQSVGLQILYHMDNQSLFGERADNAEPGGQSQLVHNFATVGIDSTTAYSLNTSDWVDSGKFGGAFHFFESGAGDDTLDVDGFNGTDGFASNISHTVWINVTTNLDSIMARWGTSGDDRFFNWEVRSIDLATTNASLRLRIGLNGTDDDGAICDFTARTFENFSDALYHHVGFTASNESGSIVINLYYNGTNIGIHDCGFNIDVEAWADTEKTLLGNDGTGANPYRGMIDEVAIWYRLLGDEEIYNQTVLNEGLYFWSVNASDAGQNSTFNGTFVFNITSPVVAPPADDCIFDCSTENLISVDLDCQGEDLVLENAGLLVVEADIFNIDKITGNVCTLAIAPEHLLS